MRVLPLVIVFLQSLLTSAVPTINLEFSFKTTLEDYPMGYSSASFAISDDTVYVLNGANVGNAVVKFDLLGNYVEEYPGWYNWPVDLVVGGPDHDQVLLSAIGAMGDDTMLRFGMVLYNRSGEFFHGWQEAETGLKRPYGLSQLPGSDQVAVCDWDNNKTVVMDIDWEEGLVTGVQELIELPYPFRMMVTEDKVVILSSVCCETWHQDMVKMSVFDLLGNLMMEVTELPTGDVIKNPEAATVDPAGNILLSEQSLGTLVFSPEAEYITTLPVEGMAKKMMFNDGKLFVLTDVGTGEDDMDSFISVYSYSGTT